ncbi:SDR16C5 [Mytilus edulis]|uniref:SDR16C5 n=1 Tax=Mytilus edulis TaxID=6550 RepID=A0A8S3QD34_MYTED|nr:SDR16C5 [Mytilus edulis]
MLRKINDRDVIFEEAMDIVSEPNEEHQEVQETNKGRQLENDHIVTETGDTYFTTETNDIAHLEVMQKNLDPMEGASPYYKELYKRRFVNDSNDKENDIPVSHTFHQNQLYSDLPMPYVEILKLGKTGVKTTTVCPSFVSSGMVKQIKDKLTEISTPETVGAEVVKGIQCEEEHVYIPRHLHFGLKLQMFFPLKFFRWLKEFGELGIVPQYDPNT